ncbi:MAG: class I SAM-dependent methyltransferase [Halioglobus sp.]
MGYRSSSREDMQNLLLGDERASMKILDVGCGEGNFLFELKVRHGAETHGIEPDEIAGEMARAKLDKVYIGLWEDVAKSIPDGYFDAIFFNDVLEHMVQPDEVLNQAIGKLASGGKVYASIPNFLFFDNIVAILRTRNFRYEESGIMDKTHLRFFTRISIEHMFDKSEYRVESMRPLSELSSWKWRVVKSLSFGFLKDFFPFQYVVVAVPKDTIHLA